MARSDWRRPALTPMEPGYRRIKLTVAYDGSAYHGWQSQDNAGSVQSDLESAVLALTGCTITVNGSGRTDAGVHALAQVCHFDIPERITIPGEKFAPALNSRLSSAVRIISSEEMDESFHSRFTTMAREYRYFVKSRQDFLPYDEGYVAAVTRLPSLELLDSYAACLIGTHDFTTFASSRDESPSHYRDIYESYWREGTDKWGMRYYCYTVVGNAFLYHQVRSMVGTMLILAGKDAPASEFRRRLDAANRGEALTTASADGLYLARISYDEDEYRWFEEGCDGRK